MPFPVETDLAIIHRQRLLPGVVEDAEPHPSLEMLVSGGPANELPARWQCLPVNPCPEHVEDAR